MTADDIIPGLVTVDPSTTKGVHGFGVTVSAISRMVSSGRLTPVLRGEGKTGAMWFRPEDVDQLATEKAGSR